MSRRRGARSLLRLLVAVGVLATTALVLPGLGRPDPAAARFTGTIAFEEEATSDSGGTFVPDGSGGWVGAVVGQDNGADFEGANVRRVTIDATGSVTSNTLLFRSAVAYETAIFSTDVAPDGSILFSYFDGYANAPHLRAYGPSGTALFGTKDVGTSTSALEAGWLDDGRIYTVDFTYVGARTRSATIFNRDGSVAKTFPLPDLAPAGTHRAFSAVGGIGLQSGLVLEVYDPNSGNVVASGTTNVRQQALVRRGDLGYYRIVSVDKAPDQLQILDADFDVIDEISYPASNGWYLNIGVGARGNAIVGWMEGRGPFTLHLQNLDERGDPVGDPVTKPASPSNQWAYGPAFLSAGSTGQSLAGWHTETTKRRRSDRDGYLFDSSVAAVTARFDIRRTYESAQGNWDLKGSGQFEVLTFDASPSTGLPGDPIIKHEWTLTAQVPDVPLPTRLASGSDQAPEYAFRLPPGQHQGWTVRLKVTTQSGKTDVFQRDVAIAGPAVSGWARINEAPAPIDVGGVVPKTGYSESVVLEHSTAHDVAALASASTEVSWSDPAAVELVSQTGPLEDPALAAYRGGKDLTLWTPDDTEGAHLRTNWTWRPRKSGTFTATFTTTYRETSDPEDRRTTVATRQMTFNGARVEGTPQAGFGDPDNPGSIGVGGPTAISLDFDNVGYGDAEVALTLPEVDGFDLALDQDSFDLAAGAQVSRQLDVTTNRAGAAIIPVHLKVTDSETHNVTVDEDILVQINVVAGFDWSVPDRLERPDDGEVPDLPDTPGEASDVDHDSYPVDVTLTDAEDCDTEIEWKITKIGTDEEGIETRTTIDGLEPSDQDDCTFHFEFPEEGVYEIDVHIDDLQVALGQLEVQDVLWVVLGDSVASGEGNPDVPAGGSGGVGWVDSSCRRSVRSGAAQAAYDYEEASDRTSVTLVVLACSGASIAKGLLGPQVASDILHSEAKPAQLDVLDSLMGDRKPDVTVLEAGGNDLLFGPILTFCAGEGDASSSCADLGFSESTDVVAQGLTFARDVTYPRRLDPYVGMLCNDYPAGRTGVLTQPLPPTLTGGVDYTNANPNQGDAWQVIVNARRTDFSGRNAFGEDDLGPGPTDAEEFTSTEVRAQNCLGPFSPTTHPGFQVGLDGPLAQAHYDLYDSADAEIVDLTPTNLTPDEIDVLAMVPQTLDQRLDVLVDGDDDHVGLAQRYDDLAERMEDIGIPAESVLAVEYYDPLHGDDAAPCARVLGPPIVGTEQTKEYLAGVGLLANEGEWAESNLLAPLNQQFSQAAGRHGWTFVGGVSNAFGANGYCSANPYVVTLPASISTQSNVYGTMHPNAAGHGVIAQKVSAAADGLVEDPSRYDAVDPTLAGQLSRAVQAGSTALSFGASGDASDLQESLRIAVQAANPGFEVGDWVQVGTGNLLVEVNGHAVTSLPEIREVTKVTATGVEVAPALSADHLQGERVTLIPDRSLVDDPYVPGEPVDPTEPVDPVDPAQPVEPTQPVGPPNRPPSTGSPSAPAHAGSGALPRTGSDATSLLTVAAQLLAAGLIVLTIRYRMGRRPRSAAPTSS
jgi:hypothetical protein